MKKLILLTVVVSAMLMGCGTQPKMFGNTRDWSELDTNEFHVNYASGLEGVYSDGSFKSNGMYKEWMRKYRLTHK